MWRLEHSIRSLNMKVGNSLYIRQYAGGDHESQHVHGYEKYCADSKEQLYWQLSKSDSFVWDIDMDEVDTIQIEDGTLAGVLFTRISFTF